MAEVACFDENTALQYVEGLLPEEREREVEAHAARCSDCRYLLNVAGGAVLEEGPSEAITRPASPRPPRPPEDQDATARRIGEVLAGTYVIERYIGRGGMGTVYEGSHRRLPRRFAIKFLSETFADDPVAVGRLKREAEVTSRLFHPNIVEVVDFDHAEDGTPYIVMALLEGESLAQRIQRQGPITDLEEVAEISRQVASGLVAAHREGVVHRDLKPSNIFLCARGADEPPLVKIVDFGLSKIASATRESTLTRVSAVIGTPSYMSPEQASGHGGSADHRADLFALGATLFKMLTGRAPFSGKNVDEILAQVATAEIETAPGWRQIPAPLRPVIRRALSKDPAARQPDMESLWTELAAAFAAAGVTGGGRRHAGLLVGAAVLTVATAVALALWWTIDPGPPAPPPPPPAARATPPPRTDATAPSVKGPASRPSAVGPSIRRRRPARRPPRPHPTGTLIIQSKAQRDGSHLWADVYLDGKKVGRTALKLPVPSGLHRVEVRRRGYRRAARRVRVSPGGQARVVFELVAQ